MRRQPITTTLSIDSLLQRKAIKKAKKSKPLAEYSSPFPNSVKNRLQYTDYDYVDKLSKSERDWLWNFNQSYYNASTHGDKAAYDRNNARNRDLYNLHLVAKSLKSLNSDELDSQALAIFLSYNF